MQNPATNTTTVTIRSVIRSVTECAIAQGAVKPKPLAQLDAELLLAHVLQKPRSFLLTHPDHRLTTDEHRSFIQLTDCRAIGVPIAYLVGKKEFWSLSFKVTSDVLIPRPETELLVEHVLKKISALTQPKICELGTGSGAVAIAVATERPDAKVVATDISREALAIARHNAQQHNVEIQFIEGPWFEPLQDQQFDVITSNPPYVSKNEYQILEKEVRLEPETALISGDNGLADLMHLIKHAGTHSQSNGWLILEHGATQHMALQNQFEKCGYQHIETAHDLAKLPRVTLGQLIGTQ